MLCQKPWHNFSVHCFRMLRRTTRFSMQLLYNRWQMRMCSSWLKSRRWVAVLSFVWKYWLANLWQLIWFCVKLYNIVVALWWQKQKEDLHKRILQLQNQLEAKQALELEIEQLKGKLKVMEYVGGKEEIQRVEAIQKDLREKEENLDEVESLNQALIIKERRSNEELQEARKELINVRVTNQNLQLFWFSVFFVSSQSPVR